jgi:hypothetical protein
MLQLIQQRTNYVQDLLSDFVCTVCHVLKYNMRIKEVITAVQPKKPPTPQQLKIKSLQQGVERSRQQLDAERDRQRQQREAERKRKVQQSIATV